MPSQGDEHPASGQRDPGRPPSPKAEVSDWTGARLAAAGLDPTVRSPLRRRLRAKALGALTRGASYLPRTALAPALRFATTRTARGALGRRARANLQLALGERTSEQERERILRACFAHGARQASEWLRLSRGAAPGSPAGAWIEQAVQFDESFEVLRRQPGGALIVTAHLGNWELLAAALARRGYGGAVVGRVNRLDSTTSWLPRMRQAYGVRTLPQDSAPRELLSVPRRGDVLGLLCDLEVRRLDGEFLPFFGTPALTMTAPAALARAARLPLIPARCVLPADATADTPYRLRFEDPLPPPPKGSGREGLRALLTQLLATYQAWIEETPEQWAWHQHRWRTRPGDYDAVPLAERRRIDIAKLQSR